ncbi:dTDP-4-dehydrorhamnose reductase [Desulfosporosinus acididurans]|uniref:dTDP-4-dehydrorhamnose reductase n=1 Tax=Desulfosporosinus acididurans TaxID=476652 RepID=A0A0J1FLG4_9FIRM|nr:dTDP-4-dehydrorhamnose reductase [Desulfosporosinus acididurans]KLU64364.1 dTDP-4-dehydrorhamnose reductase [Desulfosporosinus acididurans]
MKVLVTGAKGQLGSDMIKELQARNINCLGTGRDDFDITDFEATLRVITNYHPDAVIHCAAYTAVDMAEENKELCTAVNVEGTKNIAKACKAIDAKIIYISTDYVFPGTGDKAYEVDDVTCPLGVYGETKLEGELAVKEQLCKYFIVRISWVFGKNGNNFVKTMLNIGKTRADVNVVSDQIGSPTYTADLAPLLCDMLVTEEYGTYHATNEGFCSWAEFAAEIFRQAGYKTKVNFISTSEYPTKAHRPSNSRLSKVSLDLAGFSHLPSWQDGLNRYLKEII